MTVYAQQINTMVEQLPISEQQFIVELIKKISFNRSVTTKEILDEKAINERQKKTVAQFIKNINAITNEPLDAEFDEILSQRINITRELDL